MSKQPTKIYGIFKRTDKGLLGYTENSFCMSWEADRVRVWRRHHIETESFMETVKNKKEDVFLVRLNSKMSPVNIVDWHPRCKDTKKYDWRNAKFALKKLAVR